MTAQTTGTMSDWIVSNPSILGGKPHVRGTRITVEFLLELAGTGATPRQILAGYPQVTAEGLAAAFQFAAKVIQREQSVARLTPGRAARPRRVGLRGWGSLKRYRRSIDAAFAPEVDAEVARVIEGRP